MSWLRLACSLALAPLSWGQIDFETTELSHDAQPNEPSFEAVFPFTNIGSNPVKVHELLSSCGCTVPELTKRLYAPGQSGEVRAIFSYGSRSGPQEKTVTVRTSEGDYSLVLRVNIPEKWRLEKRIASWNGDELSEPRSIHIDFPTGQPIELISVEINRDEFSVEPVWSADGKALDLRLTPAADAPPGLRRYNVNVRNRFGEKFSIAFYARIHEAE